MKRMFYLILCLAMTFVFVCSPVSAARPAESAFRELDAGGRVINSGYYALKGPTSLGTEGSTYIWCWIEYGNGDERDRVTAYIEARIGEVDTAKIQPVAWYADPDEGEVSYSEMTTFNYIPQSGISATVFAGNNCLIKGTAAHFVRYATLGEWICGTTIIV